MTPQIALDLSLDGIVVLSRVPDDHADAGKWWREGQVRLDDPDMPKALARLRKRAADRAGDDFTSILILPDSQLLYTSLELDDRRPEDTIRALLRGRTPYPVEDLAFDYVQRGDRLQVAVVALETLLEAETFAADYGFRPVALVANPSDPAYPSIPAFGQTGIAPDLLGDDKLDLNLTDGFRIAQAPPPAKVADKPEAAAPVPEATPTPAPSEAPAADTPKAEAAEDPKPVFASPRRAKGAPLPKPATADDSAAPRIAPRLSPPKPAAEAPNVDTTPDDKQTAPDAPTPTRFTSATRKAPLTADARQDSVDRLSKMAPRINPVGPAVSAPAPKADASLRAEPQVAKPKAAEPTAAPKAKTPAEDTPVVPAPPKAVEAQDKPTADKAVLAAAAAPDADIPAKPPAPKTGLAQRGRRAVGNLTTAAGRLRQQAALARAAKAAPPSDEELERQQAEAQALALPGLAREKAAAPKRGGSKMGLYLTVGLIGVLALIGLGSALFLPDDRAATGPDGSDITIAPADAPASADLPDLAALLPGSDDDAADPTISAASPVPGLVVPPAPIPGETPAELAEALAPGPDPDGEILPEVTPDLAVAALPDTPPSDDITAPATAREAFTAEGVFDAPAAATVSTALTDDAIEDVYVASIDPALDFGDAIALPDAPFVADGFSPQTLPPVAGATFDTGEDGLIVATAEGALAPGGYRVVLGRPAIMPVPRATDTTEAEVEAQTEADQILRRIRPLQRPSDIAERVERSENGGLLRSELSRFRPAQRPAAIETAAAAVQAAQQAAAASLAQAEAEAEATAEAEAAAAAEAAAQALAEADEAEESGPVSALALPQSDRPRTRPRSVEREAARIVTRRREQAAAGSSSTASNNQPAASQADSGRQTIRSAGGNVARAATQRNVLRLNQINLIGVYGRPNARRALVRLSNGRYVKVEVGDRLDRGRVTAIGEGQLSYQRGGRNIVLRLPRA